MDGIDDGKVHPDRTGIVIIGGGFGAMNAAMALDRQLERGLKAEVTLISRNNFFLFTPLLAEVAASLIEPRHAVNPIRRMLSRGRFIEGTVQELDPGWADSAICRQQRLE